MKNEKLLEKYNEIWNKVSNTIKKGFDSELFTKKNRQELRLNFMKEKSAQMFTEIKYQKKVLSIFAHQ